MVSILDAQGIPLRDPKRDSLSNCREAVRGVDFYAQASKMPLVLRTKGGGVLPQDPELKKKQKGDILRMAYAATPAAAASVQCSFRNRSKREGHQGSRSPPDPGLRQP